MSANDETYKTRETLLQKIKNKYDDESWEDFVSYYQSYIYMICRRMNLNHHDSEETVQKVLMIAWQNLPDFQYDSRKNFRGWLCTVTKNSVNEFYRSRSAQNAKIEKAANNYTGDKFNMPDIERIAEEEWKIYIAGMALDNIKDNFSKNVLTVFKKLSDGKARAIVAKEMGLPANTVSVYKKRVTVALCNEIRRLYYELGEL